MDIDERHCPNCGHDVLSWEVACPGCDQVPWESPAGRRIVAQRRRWAFLETSWPIAALLSGLLILGVISSLAWMRILNEPKVAQQLQDLQTQLFGRNAVTSPSQREALLDQVATLLDRDHYITGFAAAGLLTQAGDPRAIPWLIDLLDYPNPKVTSTALRYLQRITGQRFELDQRRWQQWWEAHQDDFSPRRVPLDLDADFI